MLPPAGAGAAGVFLARALAIVFVLVGWWKDLPIFLQGVNLRAFSGRGNFAWSVAKRWWRGKLVNGIKQPFPTCVH
jgi:hypothetical protein